MRGRVYTKGWKESSPLAREKGGPAGGGAPAGQKPIIPIKRSKKRL